MSLHVLATFFSLPKDTLPRPTLTKSSLAKTTLLRPRLPRPILPRPTVGLYFYLDPVHCDDRQNIGLGLACIDISQDYSYSPGLDL